MPRLAGGVGFVDLVAQFRRLGRFEVHHLAEECGTRDEHIDPEAVGLRTLDIEVGVAWTQRKRERVVELQSYRPPVGAHARVAAPLAPVVEASRWQPM
jgi:hypothetical protein